MNSSARSSSSELYVGLMSGTSLDGVDAVLLDLGKPGALLGTQFVPYSKTIKSALLALHEPGKGELDRAALIGVELSKLYARTVNRLLNKLGISAKSVRAIGCHGQTVRHRPESGYTVQLGNPAWLAERTGVTVVADFRSRDIAAGGQGAPLVPGFHSAWFRSPRRHRVIVNVGGMANLTDLPRSGPVTGFDTGPGNVLLDAWTLRHFDRDFDRSGRIAARGEPVARLLKVLLADPYFRKPPPKSTGRDRFNLGWLRRYGTGRLDPKDVQATLAELTARSIGNAVEGYCAGAEELYLCGGGARNVDLVSRIRRAMPGIVVASTELLGIHPDWVEAAAFAWLAQRALQQEPGSIPRVTGADAERVLGAIYPA